MYNCARVYSIGAMTTAQRESWKHIVVSSRDRNSIVKIVPLNINWLPLPALRLPFWLSAHVVHVSMFNWTSSFPLISEDEPTVSTACLCKCCCMFHWELTRIYIQFDMELTKISAPTYSVINYDLISCHKCYTRWNEPKILWNTRSTYCHWCPTGHTDW